jgi:uncharacterized protein
MKTPIALNTHSEQSSTLADIEPILAEVLRRLQEKFGEQLVSVVLYGSYARGNARTFSDIDLLVVLTEVPRDWDAIFALEHEVSRMGRGLGKKVQGQVLSRDDVTCSIESSTLIMLEVFDAHRILIDLDGFFAEQMQNFTAQIHQRGIRKLGQIWRVPPNETK